MVVVVVPPGDLEGHPGELPGVPPEGPPVELPVELPVILPEAGLDEDPVPLAVRESVVCQRGPAAGSGLTH